MGIFKKLYASLIVRLVLSAILATAGVIVSDLYRDVSVPLATLGAVLILIGLALIPGFGAAGPHSSKKG